MEATILYGAHETKVPGVDADGERLWVPLDELARATGWELKTQGLCQAEICVPIPEGRRGEWLDDGARRLDLAAFARHLGQPASHEGAVWAFGDAGRSSAAAPSLEAPDFTLPDLDGRPHSLSDHRGKKVLLYCWASW